MTHKTHPAHFAAACDCDRGIRAMVLDLARKHGIDVTDALAIVVAGAMANLCMAGPRNAAPIGQAMLDRTIDSICLDKPHMGESNEEIQHEARLTNAWAAEAAPRIARWR